MRTTRKFCPTYKFQATPRRQIWQAPIPWKSSSGICTAISKTTGCGNMASAGHTFSVLVQNSSYLRWLPAQQILSEQDVNEWLRSCKGSCLI